MLTTTGEAWAVAQKIIEQISSEPNISKDWRELHQRSVGEGKNISWVMEVLSMAVAAIAGGDPIYSSAWVEDENEPRGVLVVVSDEIIAKVSFGAPQDATQGCEHHAISWPLSSVESVENLRQWDLGESASADWPRAVRLRLNLRDGATVSLPAREGYVVKDLAASRLVDLIRTVLQR